MYEEILKQNKLALMGQYPRFSPAADQQGTGTDHLDTEMSRRNSMKPLRKINAAILLLLFDHRPIKHRQKCCIGTLAPSFLQIALGVPARKCRSETSARPRVLDAEDAAKWAP